ncbi:MAG: hypothetical protein ACK5CE_07045 [Actinomycetes bacterium]|nr:hypothetical protein [Actinomycetota bacterium]
MRGRPGPKDSPQDSGSQRGDRHVVWIQWAAQARACFDEHVELDELLVQIWETDGPVTWSGQHRGALDGVMVLPRLMQAPRPPMWLGAGSIESFELQTSSLVGPDRTRPPAGVPEPTGWRSRCPSSGHDR